MTQTFKSGELKYCPFCGGDFKIAQEPYDNGCVAGRWYIYHDYGELGSPARACIINVPRHFDTEQDAIAAWNTRSAVRARNGLHWIWLTSGATPVASMSRRRCSGLKFDVPIARVRPFSRASTSPSHARTYRSWSGLGRG